MTRADTRSNSTMSESGADSAMSWPSTDGSGISAMSDVAPSQGCEMADMFTPDTSDLSSTTRLTESSPPWRCHPSRFIYGSSYANECQACPSLLRSAMDSQVPDAFGASGGSHQRLRSPKYIQWSSAACLRNQEAIRLQPQLQARCWSDIVGLCGESMPEGKQTPPIRAPSQSQGAPTCTAVGQGGARAAMTSGAAARRGASATEGNQQSNPLTVVVNNIPPRGTTEDIVSTMRARGFEEGFECVFMPMRADGVQNKGFAFVCFSDPDRAARFHDAISGATIHSRKGGKPLRVEIVDLEVLTADVLD